MSLTQVFSWNDLTWWAAGNPLTAPAHSLILLTGLKDQSNGAAVAHALWRFYAWNFHKHVSVLQSDVTALVISLSRYTCGGRRGGSHLWSCTPVFSLCVCFYSERKPELTASHEHRKSIRHAHTVWEQLHPVAHSRYYTSQSATLYGCAENPASFWTLLYLYSTVVSTVDLYFIHFMF